MRSFIGSWPTILRTAITLVIGICIGRLSSIMSHDEEMEMVQLEPFDATKWDSPKYKNWTKTEYTEYVPSTTEKYILGHSKELGYAKQGGLFSKDPSGCAIWKDPKATNAEIYKSLNSYADELDKYIHAVQNFQPVNTDVLDHIQKNNNHNVCNALRLHPDGLSGLFPSNQLSRSRSGWVEPLTPPFRYHKFCWDGEADEYLKTKHLMSVDYLVHDFEAMCRNLKPTSKRVFIDMGASLAFHGKGDESPVMPVLALYEKFGFHFDHIYAFEYKFSEPADVYEQLLPEKYMASYHWINTGVSGEEKSKMNPLRTILQKFSEDDFIVIKLDIDTSSIEVPLVKQLLKGGPDGIYHKLVDQFYFEHHVHLAELNKWWSAGGMEGTIQDSLEMFFGLREKGIPAHYWP